MEINFDVWIDSEDFSVDMNTGLETFKGASEVTRKIAGTILNNQVPKKLTSDNKVRTNLKKNFKGSFIQSFSLEFEDIEFKNRFKKIGKVAFSELIAYFVHEALYQESSALSQKAQKALDNLGDDLTEELIEELRVSSLTHLHSVSDHFNKEVKLRYRPSHAKQIVLAKLNRETNATLKPITNKTKIEIQASITRLNINTGNGRLQLKDTAETVAFGFPQKVIYIQQKKQMKEKFSDNLHVNNGFGTDREKWKTLTLNAHTERTNNGRIIKYIIEGII